MSTQLVEDVKVKVMEAVQTPVRRTATAREIRYGWRRRIGMLLPSVNRVAEPEVTALMPDGVSLHTTRLKLTGSSREDLLAMTEKVEEGAALLGDAGVDLIVFHCTAVTTMDANMEASLVKRVEKASGKPATATSAALLSALHTLGANKIVLLTPYPRDSNEREVAFLAHHKIMVVREAGMEITEGAKMGLVEPGDWYRYAQAHRHDEADAYFLSCTAIRAMPIIEALESDLGKPVITSNQAMAWHVLRSVGVRDAIQGYGTLLSRF